MVQVKEQMFMSMCMKSNAKMVEHIYTRWSRIYNEVYKYVPYTIEEE